MSVFQPFRDVLGSPAVAASNLQHFTIRLNAQAIRHAFPYLILAFMEGSERYVGKVFVFRSQLVIKIFRRLINVRQFLWPRKIRNSLRNCEPMAVGAFQLARQNILLVAGMFGQPEWL